MSLPHRPLRVALIGAGNIAAHHLVAYAEHQDTVELVAICDVDVELARSRARDAGVEHVFSDAEALLREAEIEAVDICTPHDVHAPLAIAAAEAGKHVLVEKPFGRTLAECRAMLAAADRAGVTLMVGQNQRFLPSYQSAKALIQAGELGAVLGARWDSFQHWQSFIPTGHWQYDGLRAGGSAVINVGVHRIDLLRFLVGDVRRVWATTRTTRAEFLNGAEDFAAVTLEFENGALGQAFMTVSGFRLPWSEHFVIFGEHGTMHAVPSPGTVRSPAFVASAGRTAACEVWLDQYAGFEPVDASAEGLVSASGQVNEILHFAHCIRTGAEPLSSGRDNLGTMKVVAGIYESARTGAAVELAEL